MISGLCYAMVGLYVGGQLAMCYLALTFHRAEITKWHRLYILATCFIAGLFVGHVIVDMLTILFAQ